jgi:hypothetical protein
MSRELHAQIVWKPLYQLAADQSLADAKIKDGLPLEKGVDVSFNLPEAV